MVNGLIGKKLGMTRVFVEDGRAAGVTVIQAGPCTVVQKKTNETDGYNSLQLGFGARKKANRPLTGHFKAAGGKNFRLLREFLAEEIDDYEVGQEIDVNIFEIGERVNVTGTTKGRGFTGVMKRHGFSGGSATEGMGPTGGRASSGTRVGACCRGSNRPPADGKGNGWWAARMFRVGSFDGSYKAREAV